jgi:hypothetical protein
MNPIDKKCRQLLNLSERTIDCHRNNIRAMMGACVCASKSTLP